MYIFINYWFGTILGGIVATLSTLTFLIAFLTFTPVDGFVYQYIVAEIAAYLFLTFGLWNIAYRSLVPKAYEYLQLGLPKSERTFRGSE